VNSSVIDWPTRASLAFGTAQSIVVGGSFRATVAENQSPISFAASIGARKRSWRSDEASVGTARHSMAESWPADSHESSSGYNLHAGTGCRRNLMSGTRIDYCPHCGANLKITGR
jgi:hypothetical protein